VLKEVTAFVVKAGLKSYPRIKTGNPRIEQMFDPGIFFIFHIHSNL
jgi:hypothetical protein